jgi:hypothetical protein
MVEQGEGMGISSELQGEGYALLCVSYPRSNLKIETKKEYKVYSRHISQSEVTPLGTLNSGGQCPPHSFSKFQD